jgi:tetrahydromethanopterin S-methyltransferase subunit F
MSNIADIYRIDAVVRNVKYILHFSTRSGTGKELKAPAGAFSDEILCLWEG